MSIVTLRRFWAGMVLMVISIVVASEDWHWGTEMAIFFVAWISYYLILGEERKS